jgi:hypothetical protein
MSWLLVWRMLLEERLLWKHVHALWCWLQSVVWQVQIVSAAVMMNGGVAALVIVEHRSVIRANVIYSHNTYCRTWYRVESLIGNRTALELYIVNYHP